MTAAEGGGIFVSYRRQETSHLAGRLYDRLADRFGEGQVFIDVDTIEPGVDFAEEIFRAVAACKVLLAIIGPTWLIAADERGRRRLDDPDDLVRLEIEAALARGVRVIPILVEGAVMPAREDLPESLAGLARRNALRHPPRELPVRRRAPGDGDRAGAGGSGTAVFSPGCPGCSLPTPNASPTPSPTRRSKAWTLGAIARRWQPPTRTAPNASPTPSPTSTSKASALSRVAEALAATDPDRAARLFADAERIANSITDKSEGIGAATASRGRWQPPTRTAPNASPTPSPTSHSKASALSRIAEALAATDPDRAARLLADAERIANSITDECSKASALSGVAEALAATDPDRAERIANSITDEYWKASALSDVAEALAATDPDRAARLLADAERIANSITDESSKASALSRRREGAGSHRPRPRRTHRQLHHRRVAGRHRR